jgi:pimeloyl-ACP methyl ester carboxylesterase
LSTVPPLTGRLHGWTVYCDDLIRLLETLDAGPAILAGHSMGAVVSLKAAIAAPARVRGVVLAEPVAVPGVLGLLRALAHRIGWDVGPSLARRAAQRRAAFPSRQDARDAYTNRGAFRTWPAETLADYLDSGLVPDGGGVRLACSPAWEAATFHAAPTGIARLAPQVHCPMTVLRGTIASTCPDSQAALFARAGAHVVKADGASHFLPMEYPDLVRHEIERLASML